tara:strand:+ start:599 stop:919 length:321 start_codon:yes stop_codon:yes gene_type:complete
MANYYTSISENSSILPTMLSSGGEYGLNPSQKIDCKDIDCDNVVGVGATFSGELKCTSTAAPFYPPVVTESQRDSMTVTKGAMVFNSTTNKLNVHNGSSWRIVTSS